MVFDHAFKRGVAGMLAGCKVEQNVPVGKLPLEIDLLVSCATLPPPETRAPALSRRFSHENVIEYKSSHDRAHDTDLWKLAA